MIFFHFSVIAALCPVDKRERKRAKREGEKRSEEVIVQRSGFRFLWPQAVDVKNGGTEWEGPEVVKHQTMLFPVEAHWFGSLN